MTRGSSFRYHSLDIWRGIACLLVILFHTVGSDGSPGNSAVLTTLGSVAAVGWIGVPLFFVISGYCIAATASRPQRFTDYFFRRVRRIFPPLWIFLVLTGAVVLLVEAGGVWEPLFGHHHGGGRGFGQIVPPTRLSVLEVLGNLSLTAGWHHWLAHAGGPFWRFVGSNWWLDHLWSLGYEEQFYIVVGLLLMTLGRFWWRGVEILTAGIAIFRIACPPEERLSGFFFDGYWLLFALGLLLFHHLNIAKGWRRFVLPSLLVVATPFVTPLLASTHMALPISFAVALLFTGLLLVAHPWDQKVAASPALNPLAWCGRRCYSIYLVHWPVTKAITGLGLMLGLMDQRSMWLLLVPTTTMASLAVAYPFHRYVERRFMEPASSGAAARRKSRNAVAKPMGETLDDASGRERRFILP